MRFKDNNHEELFKELCERINRRDSYHLSLVYLLALDTECRKHTKEIFDFEEDCIRPEVLDKPWQTSGSKRTTMLAFNLWNDYCLDMDKLSSDYNVSNIFCCSYAPYYYEAVKLRYPNYTKEEKL